MHGIERFLQDFHNAFAILSTIVGSIPAGTTIKKAIGFTYHLFCITLKRNLIVYNKRSVILYAKHKILSQEYQK